MKRPRGPVKRKAASKKIVKRKKPVDHKIVRGLKQALEMTIEDAAAFDVPKPPAGMAYQWSPVARTEYLVMKGWSRVPYSRHPELPRSLSFDGYVVYRGMALFQISHDIYIAERDRLAELGRDAVRDADDMMGRKPDERGFRSGFYILSPQFVVSSDYGAVAPNAPPVSISLPITVIIPADWQDAAAACRLEISEYTRRRLTQEGMLLAADYAGIFSPFELTTRKVD